MRSKLEPIKKWMTILSHKKLLLNWLEAKNVISLGDVEGQNNMPLCFLEGFNNKIRVLQRRAYGLKDEEYLRLKVLSCMLPEI